MLEDTGKECFHNDAPTALSENSAEVEQTALLTSEKGRFSIEVRRILQLAGPIAFQDVLLMLQDVISFAFVGHIDKTSLSCMTLAGTMFNLSGLSLVMGLASGAETLSGQCFGAKNYKALGVTLQKSLLITWLLCVMVVGAWTQLGHLLLATGQDPAIVDISMKLVWLRLPALFFLAVIECLKRYLMAQGIVTPTCVAYIATTILSPLINWTCIFGFKLGIEGSAIANDITCFLNCGFLLAYVVYYNRSLAGTGRETWAGWSPDCLKGWGQYYKLAIPATIMLCLEWWMFEAIIIMTGLLPDAETNLAVIGALFNLGGLAYMIPLGLQGAVSTRVSNELGSGHPYVAQKAVRAGMSVGTCSQACISLLFFTFRHQLGYILTSDTEVVRRTADILPIMCSMIIFDGCNACFSGAIRGCGRQVTAACMNLATFWGLGVPLAAILGFKTSLAVKGLWLGVATSVWAQFASMMTFISCLNWESEAARAAILVDLHKKTDDQDSIPKISEHTWLKADPHEAV